ncbi:integral membrane protein [Liparis tanakae]|uniref:Integral membrane protein n=1 Tax=Liparis tanakae TaxID=230148 RepID=A0A4Z2F5R5_9TELE|nr:integral membrane protein [Liparis tanakae]
MSETLGDQDKSMSETLGDQDKSMSETLGDQDKSMSETLGDQDKSMSETLGDQDMLMIKEENEIRPFKRSSEVTLRLVVAADEFCVRQLWDQPCLSGRSHPHILTSSPPHLLTSSLSHLLTHHRSQLQLPERLLNNRKMGKINGLLKCLFVFFNVLYAILGCVLIYLVVKSSSYGNQMSTLGGPSMGWGWVFAIGILAIACLGIYAGVSENVYALKTFAGLMVVGMIVMMIFGIIVVVVRNKVKEELDNTSSELIKPLMDNKDIRAALEEIQSAARCCGVVSAQDWGNNIPNSCRCRSTSYECEFIPESCSEVIFSWANFFCQIVMGFFFGLAVTALLGLLISILMVHQRERKRRANESSVLFFVLQSQLVDEAFGSLLGFLLRRFNGPNELRLGPLQRLHQSGEDLDAIFQLSVDSFLPELCPLVDLLNLQPSLQDHPV